MKTVLLAAVASLALVFAAHADELNTVSGNSSRGCVANGSLLRHTVATLPSGPQCCAEQMRCTQLLSTVTVSKPRRDLRT